MTDTGCWRSPTRRQGGQDDYGRLARCGDGGKGTARAARRSGSAGCLTRPIQESRQSYRCLCTRCCSVSRAQRRAWSRRRGVTFATGNIDLAGAERVLLMRAGREYALKRALAKFSDRFDVKMSSTVRRRWVCSPSAGYDGRRQGHRARCSAKCWRTGVSAGFLRTVADVRRWITNRICDLGALPTLHDSQTTHTRDVLLDNRRPLRPTGGSHTSHTPLRWLRPAPRAQSVMFGRKNKGTWPTASWRRRCSNTGRQVTAAHLHGGPVARADAKSPSHRFRAIFVCSPTGDQPRATSVSPRCSMTLDQKLPGSLPGTCLAAGSPGYNGCWHH